MSSSILKATIAQLFQREHNITKHAKNKSPKDATLLNRRAARRASEAKDYIFSA